MKTIIYIIAYLVIFLIPFSGISYGQPETTTVCISLYITDDCSGEWNGYYYARVSVSHGGEYYCQHTFYNLDDKYQYDELSYDCVDLPYEYYSPAYTIYVTVCRQEENSTCCDSDSKPSLYYYNLDDCSSNMFNMTLTN